MATRFPTERAARDSAATNLAPIVGRRRHPGLMKLPRARDAQRELASVKLSIAKWKRSDLARDSFRRGWKGGYSLGRRDERLGVPETPAPRGLPNHPQVLVDGVEVDERLAPLLHTMWTLGLDTQFSCQGDPDRYVPNHPGSWDASAQIFFADVDEAIKFVKKSKDLLGHLTIFTEGGFRVDVADGVGSPTLRGDLRFSPELIAPLTSAWESFAATVRANSA